MPYITVISYCVMCGRKRVTFADGITPLCCVECYEWMIDRRYPVDTMLSFAVKYWERSDKRLKAGWDDAST